MEEIKEINDVVRNQRNYVAIVLDQSGSMAGLRQTAINGLNEYIQTIRKQTDQQSFVTLCVFSDKPEFQFFNNSPDILREITEEQYQPSGNTAMYDAIGETLFRLEESTDINDSNNAYLIVIISDGQENSSKVYKSEQIAEQVKKLTDLGNFTFVYIGANQDLTKVQQNFCFSGSNVANYNSYSDQSCQNSLQQMASGTDDWYEDRKKGRKQKLDFFTDDGTQADFS